jgi:hypothetical protein
MINADNIATPSQSGRVSGNGMTLIKRGAQ